MDQSQPGKQEIQALRQSHIGRLFQQVQRDYGLRAQAMLAESGFADLTPFQSEVISYVDMDGIRLTALAQRMGVTKQTLGEAVSQLEKLGYLARAQDPVDARAVLVRFAPRGEALLARAFTGKQAIEAQYRKILGEADFLKLKDCLKRILEQQSP